MTDEDARKNVIDLSIGPRPPWSRPFRRLDWLVMHKLLVIAGSGERLMRDESFFARCVECYKLRTNRGMQMHAGPCRLEHERCVLAHGQCKCGGWRISNSVGRVGTLRLAWQLLRGY